jgi:hypothetical protein
LRSGQCVGGLADLALPASLASLPPFSLLCVLFGHCIGGVAAEDAQYGGVVKGKGIRLERA